MDANIEKFENIWVFVVVLYNTCGGIVKHPTLHCGCCYQDFEKKQRDEERVKGKEDIELHRAAGNRFMQKVCIISSH